MVRLIACTITTTLSRLGQTGASANARTTRPEEHQLFPYLHSFSNHLTTGAHLLRSARIPDVVPADILEGRAGGFSLVAGDFEEIYGPAHWFDHPEGPRADGDGADADSDDEDSGNINQRGRWGAVVTCFFIDTARNVLNYLRIIHGLLADGGVWINLGEFVCDCSLIHMDGT